MDQELTGMITETITRSVENHNSSGMYREPLIGFSAADDPLYGEVKTVIGPWHKYPAEVLPEVKSIVSFFIPFSRAVVESNRAVWPEPAREWVTSYHDCNSLLDLISEEVARALRDRGFLAVPIVSTGNFDSKRFVAPWSHRSAAFIAGLGRFGLNRMLITRKGCAGRYGTVLTSAQLPPGVRKEEEYCLFFAKGTCRYCIKHCPKQALSEKSGQDIRRASCMEQCERPSAYRPGNASAECCGKCAVGPCAYFD